MTRNPGERFAHLPRDYRRWIYDELGTILLTHPYVWRQRKVETITPANEIHYRDRLSYQLIVQADQLQSAIEIVAGRVRGGMTARDALLARLRPGDVVKELRSLEKVDWSGQNVPIRVPLVALPKRVLLTPDLEDGEGRRLTLENRFTSSHFAMSHIISSSLWSAQIDVDLDLQIPYFARLLRALCFSIPRSLLHESNFDADELKGDRLPEHVACMSRYLAEEHGLAIDDEIRAEIRTLLAEGLQTTAALRGKEWADIEGVRDPLVNPLLLYGDYRKLYHVEEEPLAFWPAFANRCQMFLATVRLLTNLETPATTTAVEDLGRFTHTWIALANVRVTVAEPFLLKLTSTVPIRKAIPVPFRGVRHRYPVTWGDAQSTHIEVKCPDPSSIRIRRSKLALGNIQTKGSEGLRLFFSYEHSRSNEVSALYTTKSTTETKEVLHILEKEQGMPESKGQRAEEGRLTVTYRLPFGLAFLYLVVGALALGVAVVGWWRVVDDAYGLTAQDASITGFVALLVGLLAVRERSLAARAGYYSRRVLGVSLIVLLALVVTTLAIPLARSKRGETNGNPKAAATQCTCPSPSALSPSPSSRKATNDAKKSPRSRQGK